MIGHFSSATRRDTTRICAAMIALLFGGCSSSIPDSKREVDARLASTEAADRESFSSTAIEFDFGPVLAHGQTLRHDFTLTNPTNHPIRLLKAEALRPCCSAVGPIPESIPPGGRAGVPVLLRPGFQSGRRQVQFTVQTDWAERPVWLLTAVATLWSEVDVRAVEGQELSLLMGESGRQALRIVCRRYRDQGRGAPESIEVAGTAGARFVGERRERRLETGVVETTRDVAVDIPPRSTVGSQAAGLAFVWNDGRRFEHAIHWYVAPHLRASPEGLIVGPQDTQAKSILIRSQTASFRVTGIEGRGIVPETSPAQLGSAAKSHVVRLRFDRSRLLAAGPFDVTIRTDHPEQPTVVVSVLMATSESRGAP